MTIKLQQLYVATLLATLPTTALFAAALERSNQSIQAFLEPGNYAEAGFNVTDLNLSGKTTTTLVGNAATSVNGNIDLGKVGDTYLTPKVAAKVQINEKFSVGLLYDQPFGIDTNYAQARRYFKVTPTNPSATQFKIDTKDITLLFGYKPTENFTLYAGPTYQELDGNFVLRGGHQRGQPTPEQGDFQLGNFSDDSYGWVAGLAFTSNDSRIKSSLTYRSENTYKFTADDERLTILNYPSNLGQNKITLPQSVNLDTDFQILPKTSIGASVRWINWKKFEMNLPLYTYRTASAATTASGAIVPLGLAGGYDPIEYKKDQWSIDLGIDQTLNEKWKVNASVGWDSGVGEYISHYTPINGSWSAGLGFQFSPASNYFVQTGVKYIWLDNVKGQHARQLATNSNLYDTEFNDGYALSYDFKIGYRF